MIRRPGAFETDLFEQAAYIARDNIDAAERLVDSVEATLRALERMPRLGRVWRSPAGRRAEVRHRAVNGFPNQLLFYRVIDGGIEALRLLHAARDLGRALSDGDSSND